MMKDYLDRDHGDMSGNAENKLERKQSTPLEGLVSCEKVQGAFLFFSVMLIFPPCSQLMGRNE